MGRKSRLFAHLNLSPELRFAELKEEIGKSLRPHPQIFPFCGDYRRRRVRSGLVPPVALCLNSFSVPNRSRSFELLRDLGSRFRFNLRAQGHPIKNLLRQSCADCRPINAVDFDD